MASYSPAARQILDLLHGRVVAFHPALVPLLGGPDEALLVSQLLFWDGKGSAPARWIYKTQGEWEGEIGLSVYRQRRARRRLRELGVLEERRGGMPARLYYRLNLDVLAALAGASPDTAEPDCPASSTSSRQDAGQDRDTVDQLAGGTYAEPDREDPPLKSSPAPRAISERTAQITTPDGAGPGPYDLVKIWRRICANVRLKVSSRSFEAWILPCVLCGLEEEDGRIRAYVETRSQYEREWLIYRMGDVLPRAFREELGRDVDLVYCLPGESPPVPAAAALDPPALSIARGAPGVPSSHGDPGRPDEVGPPHVRPLPEAAHSPAEPQPMDPVPSQESPTTPDVSRPAVSFHPSGPADAPQAPRGADTPGPSQASHSALDAPVRAGGGRRRRHGPARPRPSGRSSLVPATAATGLRRRVAERERAPPGRPRRAGRR